MKPMVIFLIVLVAIMVIVALIIIIKYKRSNKKKMLDGITNLDIKKNDLDSRPVLVELSKIEEIAKNEQLEEKIKEFKVRYEEIKKIQIVKINDMIVNLDVLVEKHSIKEFYDSYADVEIALSETEYSIDKILEEIDEIASCEEKYRNIITKLKAKYRFLQKTYEEKESLLGQLKDVLSMQFENIEKRFSDFDIIMEEKLYNEIPLVVNAIDTMIDHMDVLLRELPDILLLINDLIPNRIKDLKDEYNRLISEQYPLEYMNFDDNIQNVENRKKEIIDRAKVLNINNSLFDLRNILEYLDNMFKDFEKEKVARKEFENNNEVFNAKVKKIEKVINGLYDQMDDIKELYGLKEKDLDDIDNINLRLSNVIKEYKNLLKKVKKQECSYMKINIELYELMQKLNYVDEDFDKAIKSLGSIYDDETRAKEQLKEIRNLLKECKEKVRMYHLPIILDSYYIELNDANEAILEIEKELDKKPIVVKVLNIRVDTARDLVFKLWTTTNEMVKNAYFTELLLVYANRYREDIDVDRGLSKAEMLYFRGEYDNSLNLVLKVLELKEKGVNKRFLELSER